jgi:ubiquitin C-terminal hydrolase
MPVKTTKKKTTKAAAVKASNKSKKTKVTIAARKKSVLSKTKEKTPANLKLNHQAHPSAAVDHAENLKSNHQHRQYIIIDYPCESEKINGGHYAVRIGASGIGYVEISFNDGEWLPCRFNSGYWWFDWTDFNSGSHSISARLVSPKGEILLKTNYRKCIV